MKTRKISLFLLALLVLSALSACASSRVYAEKIAEDGGAYSYPMEAPAADAVYEERELVMAQTANSGFGGGGDESGSLAPLAQTADRLVIKNANLTIIVPDPIVSVDRISQMAEALGGYVVGANLYQTYLANGGQAPQGTLTLRVPVEKLDEALTQIKAETSQPVRNENISSEDVTSQYTDLESRLRNLEAAEAQLQKIMEQAVETEDVLSVYNHLVQTREQIEIIKGQMKYYAQSAALSLITVELIPDAATQPLQIGGWQPEGVAREAVQDLIYALQDLTEWLIRFAIYTLPLLLITFLPIVLVVWGLRRWIQSRKVVKTPPPAAKPASE